MIIVLGRLASLNHAVSLGVHSMAGVDPDSGGVARTGLHQQFSSPERHSNNTGPLSHCALLIAM